MPALALDTDAITALLREAGLPADEGFEELSSTSMGFSGARIVELRLRADGRRLVLKARTPGDTHRRSAVVPARPHTRQTKQSHV